MSLVRGSHFEEDSHCPCQTNTEIQAGPFKSKACFVIYKCNKDVDILVKGIPPFSKGKMNYNEQKKFARKFLGVEKSKA